MSSTHIASIRARRLDIPMKKAFGIAGGAQELAANVLVEVTLASGVRGWGEAAPLPAFNGETQAAALETIERVAPELVGADVRAFRELGERIFERAAASASAACAMETAVFDALARANGTSLRAFFGGAEEELVTDVTITTGSALDATRDALEFQAFSTLKIKVGGREGHDVDRDVARVLAVRAARPDARLLLDANGGLSLRDAIHLATSRALYDADALSCTAREYRRSCSSDRGVRIRVRPQGAARRTDRRGCGGGDRHFPHPAHE